MKKILGILTIALVLTSCACDTPTEEVTTTDSTTVSTDTSVVVTSVTMVEDTTITE